MSDWISVEDDLPDMYPSYNFAGEDVEVSETVIVNVVERRTKYTCAAAYTPNGWVTESWDCSETNRPLATVTHWMSLPEPLKGDLVIYEKE